MIEITSEPLLPPGNSLVKTKSRFPGNLKLTSEEAAKYTSRINRPQEIRRNFFDIPHLHEKNLKSGCQVNTFVPEGAYSNGALQVIALRNEIVRGDYLSNGDVPLDTKTIFDFPVDAQIEYYKQILAALQATTNVLPQYLNLEGTPVFTENAAAIVSNERHRLGRTITEPHAQIWLATHESTPFDRKQIPGLLHRERELIKVLTDSMELGISTLNQHLAEQDIQCQSLIRHSPPYGYVLITNIHNTIPVSEQAKSLTSILATHHSLYSQQSQEMLLLLNKKNLPTIKEKIFPQPSYRIYGLRNEKGNIEISISPTIFAPSGVVEAADRGVVRDPELTSLFPSPEAEAQYYGQLIDYLNLVNEV